MTARNARQLGFSLIELMVALLIGAILTIGIVQVFSASRTSYAMMEGMSRVQENARFAVDALERDLRMVGHYGCVNDQFRLLNTGQLNSHFAAGTPLDFSVSLQGYEANNTAPGPGNAVNLTSPVVGAAADWTPGLPTWITGLTPAPLKGSDVVLMRFLTPEGVPATGFATSGANVTVAVDSTKWPVLTQNGVANPSIFGVADCTNADVFEASAVAGGVVTTGAGNLNTNNLPIDFAGRYTASPAGQTVLYRAEAVAYYVANGAGGRPSLYRVRFMPAVGGATATAIPEELVEGVESLQLLYGQDSSTDVAAPSGSIGNLVTAAALGSATVPANEPNWRRVGQVRIGVIASSPDAAAAANAVAATNTNQLLAGVQVTRPTDRRYRSVYDATIALRNRLSNTN